jgi:N-acyl-D-aspartate/D-glutamate deacylase
VSRATLWVDPTGRVWLQTATCRDGRVCLVSEGRGSLYTDYRATPEQLRAAGWLCHEVTL